MPEVRLPNGLTVSCLQRHDVAIIDNTHLEVDTAWSSNLTFQPLSLPLIPVTGSGTLFTTELAAKSEITAGGDTQAIYSITNDTSLTTYSPWGALAGATFQVPRALIGSAALTEEVGVGDTVVVDGQSRQVTAVNSDTEVEVDKPFATIAAGLACQVEKSFLLVAADGRTGLGTISPDSAFEVEFNQVIDIETGRGTTDPNRTFFTLRSPNGSKFHIQVDNSGNLSGATTVP